MYTIHVHIRGDGRILALGNSNHGLAWFRLTAEQLQSSLAAAKADKAQVSCSRDQPDADPSPMVAVVIRLVKSIGLPVIMAAQPPQPVPAP
jgi:hypothetical protein